VASRQLRFRARDDICLLDTMITIALHGTLSPVHNHKCSTHMKIAFRALALTTPAKRFALALGILSLWSGHDFSDAQKGSQCFGPRLICSLSHVASIALSDCSGFEIEFGVAGCLGQFVRPRVLLVYIFRSFSCVVWHKLVCRILAFVFCFHVVCAWRKLALHVCLVPRF